jgi:hypothetical protein
MRSNSAKSGTKFGTTSSARRIRSRLLLLALTPIAAVFAFASTADAAQRVRSAEGAGVSGDRGWVTGGHPRHSGGAPGRSGGVASSTRPHIARRSGGVPPASERRYVPDEVLTQLGSDVPSKTVDGLARRLRLNRIASFAADGGTMLRWKIPDRRSVPAVIRSLKAEPIVLAAQPNYLYGLQQEPQAPGDGLPAVIMGDLGLMGRKFQFRAGVADGYRGDPVACPPTRGTVTGVSPSPCETID